MTKVKRELNETRTKQIEDLNRSLKEQEERLRREYESTYKLKEKNLEEINRQSEKYIAVIDELKAERAQINEENAHMRNLHQMTLDEKEQLHRQYQNLLNVHNQMLQLDIQKNEKSLRESQSFPSQNDYRQSQNRASAFQDQEQFRALVEALTMYKQELEYIKENNSLIQKQFSFEIQRLRDDLKSQKDENLKLTERIQQKERSPVKSPPSFDNATRKPRFEATPNNVDILRDDELVRLDREDLANYASRVRDFYLDLEERHKQ